ncbi:hypothetical protein NQ317_018906 [Molorchus minor]|uniref:Origin recognition complex subunit 1 n=1 Tax=Molorchus minor TaxID=1323400 RepID=A0ABQ9JKU7_9CUCU|nr:hypothetical protein NQ317_018906 [Molorchus minor]
MTNSAKTVNIKIAEVPVSCYYPPFKKDKSLPYEYYRSFILNDVVYAVQDYAVVVASLDIEIVKLLCIFTNKKKKAQIVVRKYILARNLKKELEKEGCTEFDNNEVVEDFTKDYIINSDTILRKCELIYAQKEECCVISEGHFNPLKFFSCRYTLTTEGLFPTLSVPQWILTERNSRNIVRTQPLKQKRKLNLENEGQTVLDETVTDENTPLKMRSPKTRLTMTNFDKSLVIKLRISERNNYCTTTDLTAPSRKSTRVKSRKSYADYISPTKSTPRKRKPENESDSSYKSTPVRNSRKKDVGGSGGKSARKNDVTPGKRAIQTPKRYLNEHFESPSGASVRRSLRLTSTEEPKEGLTPHRSSRTSKRQISSSSDRENGRSLVQTPEKRVNLDESMRRAILKGKLQTVKLDDSTESPTISLNKKPRAVKQFYYDTSSDEDDSSEAEVKKSLRTRKPVTRSRQSSQEWTPSTSSHRQSCSSDSTTSESITQTPHRRCNTNQRCATPPSEESPPKTSKNRGGRILKTPKTKEIDTSPNSKEFSKQIREGFITPSMHSRNKAVEGESTPLMKARSHLHVSYVPTALPCREKEYSGVFNFLEGKLLDGCGGCMYISGVPGTGKTATVTAVVNNLLENDDVPKFSFVNINGMRLTEPRQSYVEILKQLAGKTVSWEQAQGMLEERFTKSKKCAPVVMVIDELDVLCTKRQDVVYNLLDWPTKAKSQLIVVTIANTMDLPERLLMSRVTSRLGLTRLTFQAYTHKQLQEIVTKRLTGTDSFNPDAIQLVARKVASVSGDARRALDICRRAAEIAETEGKGQLVNMNHVNDALNAMITQPKVRAIRNCSRLERVILQSIVAEVERTGVEETTFADVYKMMVSCMAIDGFKMVSGTVALSAVARLSACRLILTDQKCNDIYQKIVLNVSGDDVYYALKND